MRKDFKKVLCEEPRHKGWGNDGKSINKLKGAKKYIQSNINGEFEDWSLPQKETMFGKRGRGTKQFGEHLQPLVRFLRKSVGKKWDDVFSEIRERCPNDNAVNAHIYQHLWGYVERYPQIIDGKVYDAPKYSSGRYLVLLEDRGRDNTFYVDEKGILCRAPRRKKDPPPTKPADILFYNNEIYVCVSGVWYKTLLKPIGKAEKHIEQTVGYKGRIFDKIVWRYPAFHDVYLGATDRMGYDGADGVRLCQKTYKKKVYCWRLIQLNSRKMRKIGLK